MRRITRNIRDSSACTSIRCLRNRNKILTRSLCKDGPVSNCLFKDVRPKWAEAPNTIRPFVKV
ncbi:hypothetical protein T02_3101 [Trichinella nativa]|uniref:Uncharacterized protein n=1 Tax=Trichinella nativa TaxID=6335 RepID=A0A0V1KIM1_9BILA|nr:hypothetical protein T02_3101 [Trichinella nativa]